MTRLGAWLDRVTEKSGVDARMWIALVVLTLFRLWLFVRTPLFLQGDAGCDDRLMVDYALSMLNGEWLGAYNDMTLVKVPAFSLLLAVGYALGLPYALSLGLTYALSCVAVSYALYRLAKSRSLSMLCYLFLLFSPVMFHEENVQKVYRGGYIVVFSLLVAASFVGLFADRHHRKRMILWPVVGALSLPVFWYLKEDSLWIAPFVMGASVCAIFLICREKEHPHRVLRTALVLVPLVALLVGGVGYRMMNTLSYGVHMTTDRQEGAFHDVIADLLKIDGKSDDPTIWVSRSQYEKALLASPTLSTIVGGIDNLCDADNVFANDAGESYGDFFIWRIRYKAAREGVYEQGAAYAESLYATAHQELEAAFADGRLTSQQGVVRLSSVAPGYTADELAGYYATKLPEALACIIPYAANRTGTEVATGDAASLATMAELTNSSYVWPEDEGSLDRWNRRVVRIDALIVALYRKTGWLVFALALVGHLVLLVTTILGKRREGWGLQLVAVGLLLTCLALLFGVLWFCNFLTIEKVYDYVCGGIALFDVWKCIGVWALASMIWARVRKMRRGAEESACV